MTSCTWGSERQEMTSAFSSTLHLHCSRAGLEHEVMLHRLNCEATTGSTWNPYVMGSMDYSCHESLTSGAGKFPDLTLGSDSKGGCFCSESV